MNIADLYRKTKQILSDSNAALANKGLNTVNSLHNVLTEVGKLNDSMNRLPYYFIPYPNEITENDLGRITTIGEYVFYGREGIRSVTIPDSVTTIGDKAFASCYSLTSVTIPDSVTSIGWSAFYFCTSLTSVTIPDSVTSIEDSAFSCCKNLENITIGSGITNIGETAFWNTAYYNNSINWENDVLYIGKYLIEANTSLAGDYNIKSDTLCIADYAFRNCTSLASVTIPDSVTTIGNWAFASCYSLTSVTIPDSVTTIGDKAFYGCNNLESITIGSGITNIGEEVLFSHNIKDIYINATTPPIINGVNAIAWGTKIHVPIGSGDAYKNATNWSMYANYIVEDIEVG